MRWEESLAQDMIAVPLGPTQRFRVVATPEVIARYGAPQHPSELLDRPCVRVRFPSGAEPPWEFDRDGKTLRVAVQGPLTSSSPSMLLRAALDGVGFYATFDVAVAPHLASGRLVSVLDDWCEPFPGPLLYYPSRRHPPSALRAFVDFVQDRRRREGW